MSLPVLLSAKVREAELAWASTHNEQTWSLMVRAAESFVRQYLDYLKQGRVLIVVGRGNNGGDGYYIGKLLIEAGVSVQIAAPLGAPSSGLDAEKAEKAYVALGGKVQSELPVSGFEIIIDALFGSGLNRPLSDDIAIIIGQMNSLRLDTYSVDVPSGLNSDTGQPMPICIQAKATHSFIALKPGTLTAEGPENTGKLTLDDLSVTTDTHWSLQKQAQPLPGRLGNTHKSQHGNVRIIGGWQTMGGAAMITANAALNAGAGRIFVHCDERFFPSVVAQTPELMLGNDVPKDALANTVVIVGPGLGRSVEAQQVVEDLIQQAQGVLDADALFHLAKKPIDVDGWVLTPHEAEAARLLGVDSATIQNDRVAAVLELSKRFNTTVVLKGAGTIVASDHKLVFCHPGHPAMSTPGMGDALAGIIGALLAQGLPTPEAAVKGVNWHARIGAHLAQKQRVVLASDLIAQLKFNPS